MPVFGLFTSFIVCLYVFSKIFFYDIESFSWAGAGDDWTTFQEYSRQIVVQGNWIEAGESVFYFRPGSSMLQILSFSLWLGQDGYPGAGLIP